MVPELAVNNLCHVKRPREVEPVSMAMGDHTAYHFKMLFVRKGFQIHNRTDSDIKDL